MIQGERIVLRAIERQDLATYVPWLNDPRVLEYWGRFLPLSLTEEERWYEGILKDPTVRNFAVELDSQHIGGAGFQNIDSRNRSAEVGLFIGIPELWDQGLGTDVLRTLLRFGFQTMNFHRIYLRVHAGHERAIHLYEKVGFQHEGRWRQAEFRDGRYQDVLWMSFLSNEWSG
jgi:RimJ/RimL family protein N-acetyltransferase